MTDTSSDLSTTRRWQRRLSGVRLVTGNKCAEMLGAPEEMFPRGSLRALHGAFLPQRPGKGFRDQAKNRVTHVGGEGLEEDGA